MKKFLMVSGMFVMLLSTGINQAEAQVRIQINAFPPGYGYNFQNFQVCNSCNYRNGYHHRDCAYFNRGYGYYGDRNYCNGPGNGRGHGHGHGPGHGHHCCR